MTDPLSLPRLPVNPSEVLAGSPVQLQHALNESQKATGLSQDNPQLIDACQQMESLFIYHLFKEMRATIRPAGLISGGRAEEIYTSMMDAEVAAKISNRGGIGLADMLLHQLGRPPARGRADESGSRQQNYF